LELAMRADAIVKISEQFSLHIQASMSWLK
jgi:hypothetical protein